MTQNHYQVYFCEENDIPNSSTMINEQQIAISWKGLLLFPL